MSSDNLKAVGISIFFLLFPKIENMSRIINCQLLKMSDYSSKSRAELIKLCKERNIKGYSTKKKEELITLLTPSLTQEQDEIVKPPLKWVGGKTQILTKVLATFPDEIQDYYEPFLGGGSVLLGLLSKRKENKIKVSGKIYASDLNQNIITLYRNIQLDPEGLITEVQSLVEEYGKIKGTNVNRKPSSIEEAKTSQESYYYWIRGRFNSLTDKEKETPKASAMLLFLNKTCFRGVYREGPNGFNVPFGNYNNPSIIDELNIRAVSELIKDVEFTTCTFKDGLKNPKEGDFVYLDPPYAPETSTSFVGYTADGFNLDTHSELFNLCKGMTEHKIKWVMSNADVNLVKNEFSSSNYTVQIVEARRAINSKRPESKTKEVLIVNY
jgi:DNA adenine methylase